MLTSERREFEVEALPPLWSDLDRVYRQLERAAGGGVRPETPLAPNRPLAAPDHWDPVGRLRELFGLSAFEMDILLVCAGAALDQRFQAVLARLQPELPMLTFGLAAAVLDQPHWSALSRVRPLRYWRLIEIEHGGLLQAPLQIDERILQYLLGVPAADDRLDFAIHPLAATEPVAGWGAETNAAAFRGALHWRNGGQSAILLTGARQSDRTTLFMAMCREAGLHAWVLDSGDLPDAPADRERLARAYTRECALWPAALLVRTGRLEQPAALEAWLRRVTPPVAVDVENGSPAERLSGLRLAAPSLNPAQRKAEWRKHLGAAAAQLDGELDAMVEAFALDANEIHETAQALEEEIAAGQAETPAASAWRLCRTAARRSLDELAARVESPASWPDLVLPEAQTALLRQIVMNARHAARVNQEWGFAERYSSGLGLSALFSGASGTGKTMAAGVLACELNRDLYQIDLATVVSKYIGETEKHLRKIFDAAERSGAILLFDEADALFGKRSQVRDSHDRYANLEVSYLLQRMESYRGIAILTTNMHNSLDTAFQRRLRFVVQFPFPDGQSRERIWRKVFPAAAPTRSLDYERLAQLNVTGGAIRNIAVLAAFLAADEGAPIGMRHVLEGARAEYAKLDKPLSAAETRGWGPPMEAA
jgi:ATPase family associated with various cellular activities (AAA)